MDVRKIDDVNKAFVTKNGTQISSIKELYGHLVALSDHEFLHHVNEQKNDFASWVEHVHGDKALAHALRQAVSKEATRKVLFMSLFR